MDPFPGSITGGNKIRNLGEDILFFWLYAYFFTVIMQDTPREGRILWIDPSLDTIIA
jgi:hypothetical protein